MFSPVIRKSIGIAATGSVLLGVNNTAFAEEKKKTKLSIYNDPEPSVVIVESPTKLEEQVHLAHHYKNKTWEEGKSRVDTLVQQYQQVEHKVTSNVRSTIDPTEELMPNALYVGVAALGGTILARNRNIVLRFLTSTALAIGASYYFLPKTTQNMATRLEKFEQKFPQVVEMHAKVNKTVEEARQQVEGARKQMDETVQQLRGTVDIRKQLTTKQDDTFEQVKKNVESMYTTRSKPGVDETLKKSN